MIQKMKKCLSVIGMLIISGCGLKTFSQPTIITDNSSYTTGETSAVLDVYSTSRGMLIPRMTAAQKSAISSPATGLMVYQTDGTSGFYYYDGSSWVQLTSGSNSTYLKADGTTSLTGNLRLNNNYLSNDGDNEGIRVDNSGNVYIGGANINHLFYVTSSTKNRAIGSRLTTTSGDNYGVFVQVDGASTTSNETNCGVYALAYGKTGSSSANYGIYGNSTGTGTWNFGVLGKSTGTVSSGTTYNYGVYGLASGNNNQNVGVWGESEGTGSFNAGVAGRAQTNGTTNYGVYGGAYGNQTNYAVYGYATGGTNNYAVYGYATGTNPYSFYGGAGTLYNNGNVGIGTTSFGTSADKVLAIGNGTAPTSSIANGVQLYAEDVSASSELKVRDEAGNITTLSPHNFSLVQKSEPMAWSFYSENSSLQQRVNVDMMKAIRLIEQLSGEKLVYIQDMNTGEMIENNNYKTGQIELLLEQIEYLKRKVEKQEKRIEKLERKLKNK